MTETPVPLRLSDAPRADDGHYGPDSVSWRVFSDPSSGLGAKNALFLQMLEPGMMTHFERVSLTSEGADEMAARFDRTAAYLRDSIFADTAHADAAATRVDHLHERASWTNPETGEVVSAKQPEWMRWTWWTYIWSAVRGYQEFGPGLSTEDSNRVVVESHRGAKQLHVPGPYFETFEEVDQYVSDGLNTKALTIFAAMAGHSLRHPDVKGPVAKWVTRQILNGVLSLLPDQAKLFFAVEDRSAKEFARGARFTKLVATLARKNRTAEDLIAQAIGESVAAPYQRVRVKRRPAAA
ncbi:oxygenase MpaB family protein [Dietzia sp. UBA5065]|uniref:oxygenase MpaB family protein n=1 Tax=Dietzia sp. UBA5065 TaxID=1946422 RepID=UPI0025C27679|nr:oxygenase MpaB family protein [Dietzia sp. UBA5065]